MRIHRTNFHIQGLNETAYDAVRLAHMITPSAQERMRILAFFDKHGLAAAREAFTVSRPTLYRWKGQLKAGGGKLESLVPQSTAPIHRRKRIIPKSVEQLILKERAMERVGKVKIAKLLHDDQIMELSSSTAGRMLADLKQQGKLPDPQKLSLYGRTGNLIERKPKPHHQKLRSKGHEGALVKADTVVRFKDGIKRYILTAIDLESEFAFAYGYASHASKSAADFMRTFKAVAPLSLTHVQTDNGSEFADHFEAYCADTGIVHFHAYPRSPKMNAEVERFNRTLSEAFISSHLSLLAHDLPEFNRQLMVWLLWYNTRRPHWSIGLVSPLRYICNKLTVEKSQMCWTSTTS